MAGTGTARWNTDVPFGRLTERVTTCSRQPSAASWKKSASRTRAVASARASAKRASRRGPARSARCRSGSPTWRRKARSLGWLAAERDTPGDDSRNQSASMATAASAWGLGIKATGDALGDLRRLTLSSSLARAPKSSLPPESTSADDWCGGGAAGSAGNAGEYTEDGSTTTRW